MTKRVMQYVAALLTVIAFTDAGYGAEGGAETQPLPTIDVSYEYIGEARLKDSPGPATDEMKIQTEMLSLSIDVPRSYHEGRTTITHGIRYHQLDFNYSDVGPDAGPLVEGVHSIGYSVQWEQEYGGDWSSLIIATPGLASDFEGGLSFDDATIEFAALAIYDFTERLSLPGMLQVGFGAGYNPRLGVHTPMPVMGVRWNNGRNMKFEAIVPQMMTFAYRPHPFIDIGATAGLAGGTYHGDPDRYGVDNPQMRYSVAKAGPEVTLNILPWLRLRLHGGYAFGRRVEFYDGSEEEASYNLEDNGFVMFELQIGE